MIIIIIILLMEIYGFIAWKAKIATSFVKLGVYSVTVERKRPERLELHNVSTKHVFFPNIDLLLLVNGSSK